LLLNRRKTANRNSAGNEH